MQATLWPQYQDTPRPPPDLVIGLILGWGTDSGENFYNCFWQAIGVYHYIASQSDWQNSHHYQKINPMKKPARRSHPRALSIWRMLQCTWEKQFMAKCGGSNRGDTEGTQQTWVFPKGDPKHEGTWTLCMLQVRMSALTLFITGLTVLRRTSGHVVGLAVRHSLIQLQKMFL